MTKTLVLFLTICDQIPNCRIELDKRAIERTVFAVTFDTLGIGNQPRTGLKPDWEHVERTLAHILVTIDNMHFSGTQIPLYEAPERWLGLLLGLKEGQ